MAKKLTTQQWLRRAIEGGRETVKTLAGKLGRSPSTVRDILSGRRPGENLRESARDLAKGKRAYTPPPPVKVPKPKAAPIPPPKPEPPPLKSPMAKAEAQLAKFFDTDKVVVYINVKGTGRSVTLGAHGGITAGTILGAPSLADFLAAQGASQGYEIDWDDVVSIELEEFY